MNLLAVCVVEIISLIVQTVGVASSQTVGVTSPLELGKCLERAVGSEL